MSQDSSMVEKKLREAAYTAAVCKFLGGGTFFYFWFGSECGTAQFSLFVFLRQHVHVHLDE